MSTALANRPVTDRALEILRRAGNPFRNYFARNPDDEVCARYHVPELFAAGDGVASFTVSAGLRYDTRDSQHQPHAGWQLGLFVDAPLWQSTGDPGAVATAYGNVAFRVPPLFHRGGDEREEHPPTDTLALGLTLQASAGELPFYERPSLGGPDTLRGDAESDNGTLAAHREYASANHRLAGGQAAVHRQVDAGNVRREIGSQEQRRRRALFGFDHPAERMHAGRMRQRRLRGRQGCSRKTPRCLVESFEGTRVAGACEVVHRSGAA